MMRPSRNESGATLVELVLVTLVLTTLTAFSSSMLLNAGTVRVDAASKKLISDLTYARQLAVHRNGVYGISFNAAGNSYTVFLYDAATGAETPVEDPVTHGSMVVSLDQSPLSGVDLRNPLFGSTSKVRFNSQGIPLDGLGGVLTSAGSVHLENGGVTRTVSIKPSTGTILD